MATTDESQLQSAIWVICELSDEYQEEIPDSLATEIQQTLCTLAKLQGIIKQEAQKETMKWQP